MQHKILIVEDDADTRQGLNIRLRAADYATAFASDAIQAVTMARSEKPDLILLDLGLPAGDGFLVLQRLRSIATLASIPVIVLSARDAATNRAKALQAGATHYFEKPVPNDGLLAAIRTTLQQPAEIK